MLVCRNLFNWKVRNWCCGLNLGVGSVFFELVIVLNLMLLIVSILLCRIILFVGVLYFIFIFIFFLKKNEFGFLLFNIFGLIVILYFSGMMLFGKWKFIDIGGGVDDGDDVFNDVICSLVVYVGYVVGVWVGYIVFVVLLKKIILYCIRFVVSEIEKIYGWLNY